MYVILQLSSIQFFVTKFLKNKHGFDEHFLRFQIRAEANVIYKSNKQMPIQKHSGIDGTSFNKNGQKLDT